MPKHFATAVSRPSSTKWGQAINQSGSTPTIVGGSSALNTDDSVSMVQWPGSAVTFTGAVEVDFGSLDLASVSNLHIHLRSRGGMYRVSYNRDTYKYGAPNSADGQAEIGVNICDGNGQPFFLVAAGKSRDLGATFADNANNRRLQVWSVDGAFRDAWYIYYDEQIPDGVEDPLYPMTRNPSFDGTAGVFLYLTFSGGPSWWEFSSETTQAYLETDVSLEDLTKPAEVPFAGLMGLFNTVTFANTDGDVIDNTCALRKIVGPVFMDHDGVFQEFSDAGFQRWNGDLSFGSIIPVPTTPGTRFQENALTNADNMALVSNYARGTICVSGIFGFPESTSYMWEIDFDGNVLHEYQLPDPFNSWRMSNSGTGHGDGVGYGSRLYYRGASGDGAVRWIDLDTGEVGSYTLEASAGINVVYRFPHGGYMYGLGIMSSGKRMAFCKYNLVTGELLGYSYLKTRWDGEAANMTYSWPVVAPDQNVYWYTNQFVSGGPYDYVEGIYRLNPSTLDFESEEGVELDPWCVMPSSAIQYASGWYPVFPLSGSSSLSGQAESVRAYFSRGRV